MANEVSPIKEQLKVLMANLRHYTEGVKAIMLVSEAELPLATVIREGEEVDEAHLALMAAAARGTADRVNMELNNGDLEKFIIHGKRGIVLGAVCGHGTLVILFDKFMNLPQLVFHDIQVIDAVIPILAPFV